MFLLTPISEMINKETINDICIINQLLGRMSRSQRYTANTRLTKRFYVAVRLFSNWSQMTSKRGETKQVAHEAIAECVTDVLTTQTPSVVSGIYYYTNKREHGISL